MYVCVCVCMCVCVCVWSLSASAYVRERVCFADYIGVHMSVRLCICVYERECVYVRAYLYVSGYVRVPVGILRWVCPCAYEYVRV